MKTIKFPQQLTELANKHLADTKREYWEEGEYGNTRLAFKFSYVRIIRDHEIYNLIAEHLSQFGYKSFKGLRLNIFEGNHFIGKHEDTAFPKHETLIVPIRLECPNARLRVWPSECEHSFLVDEQPLKGLIMDEGTIHEILKSTIDKSQRITLCGWIAKEL